MSTGNIGGVPHEMDFARVHLGDPATGHGGRGKTDGRVPFQRADVDVDEDESSPWLVVRKGLHSG